MQLQTVRGGLLLDAQDESGHGEMTYYNVTQFTFRRNEPTPLWRETEAKVIREAIPWPAKSDQMLPNSRPSDIPFG